MTCPPMDRAETEENLRFEILTAQVIKIVHKGGHSFSNPLGPDREGLKSQCLFVTKREKGCCLILNLAFICIHTHIGDVLEMRKKAAPAISIL